MPAIKSQHARVFEQLVAERRQQLLEALAQGQPQDQYLKLAGQVQGLAVGLQLSEEADRRLSGEE